MALQDLGIGYVVGWEVGRGCGGVSLERVSAVGCRET